MNTLDSTPWPLAGRFARCLGWHFFSFLACLGLAACGGGGDDAATVTAPAITTQPSDTSVTIGSTATFNVVATGSAPLSYQWTKNVTVITGATGSSHTTPATTRADNLTLFAVTVSNAAGTVTSATAILRVTPAPL